MTTHTLVPQHLDLGQILLPLFEPDRCLRAPFPVD